MHLLSGISIDPGHDEVFLLRLALIIFILLRSIACFLTLQELQVMVVQQVNEGRRVRGGQAMVQSVDELLVAHWLARLSGDLLKVVCRELCLPGPRQFPLLLHQQGQSVHVGVHRDVHFDAIHLDLLVKL